MTNAGVRILVVVILKFKNDHSTSANLAYLWLQKLHQYEPLILANVLICINMPWGNYKHKSHSLC
jgi:hypothetical protein